MEPGAIVSSGIIVLIFGAILLLLRKEVLGGTQVPDHNPQDSKSAVERPILNLKDLVLVALLILAIALGSTVLFNQTAADVGDSAAAVKTSTPAQKGGNSQSRSRKPLDQPKAQPHWYQSGSTSPYQSSGGRDRPSLEQNKAAQNFYQQGVRRLSPGVN